MSFLNNGAEEARDIYVGSGTSSDRAKRVMVGTGTEAIEVWPAAPSAWLHLDTLEFNGPSDLAKAPITGFAGGSPNSTYAPGFVFEGMFVAGDNALETNHFRLFPYSFHGIKGSGHGSGLVDIRVTLGDQISASTTQRSYLVLASDANFNNMLCVSFNGESIGLDYFGNPNAGWHSEVVTTPRLVPGSKLLFKFEGPVTNPSGTFYNVYFMNENEITYTYGFRIEGADKDWLDTFIDDPKSRYAGFGVSSTANSWSPRLDAVQVSGFTNRGPDFIASEFLARIQIPSGVWTKVAESTINTGGTTNIRLVGGSWSQPAPTGNRFFRILVNGAQVGITPDEGGDLTLSNVNLSPNSVVTVWAIAEASSASHRIVLGGVLQIGDLTRFD